MLDHLRLEYRRANNTWLQALSDREDAYWDWCNAWDDGGDVERAYQKWRESAEHVNKCRLKVDLLQVKIRHWEDRAAKLGEVGDLCS